MAKNPITPRSQIISAVRQLWLRSRERAQILKIQKYTCQRCNAKKSVAKGKEVRIDVHHKNGIPNWQGIVDLIRENLLVPSEQLECLCKECHAIETYQSKQTKPTLEIQ